MKIQNVALRAMIFSRETHRDQFRSYTGNPYSDHLAEVAGIVATVAYDIQSMSGASINEIIATAWLHDCIEDQKILTAFLKANFGPVIAPGVEWLSDMETKGNRAARKAAARTRLAAAPGWVQSIKVADVISNTSSIVKHDPHFSVVYLNEIRLLLDVLEDAHPDLLAIARAQVDSAVGS